MAPTLSMPAQGVTSELRDVVLVGDSVRVPNASITLNLNARYREMVYVDGRPIRDSSAIPDNRDIAAIEAHRGYMFIRETDLWIPYSENPMSSARIVLIWTLQYMVREQERRASP